MKQGPDRVSIALAFLVIFLLFTYILGANEVTIFFGAHPRHALFANANLYSS